MTGAAVDRPGAPPGARNLVVVVLDSLRYDAWHEAAPKALGSLGTVERRWSYASWTAPSHYNLLMGLLPHASPTHVHASEYYKAEFTRYEQRLGVEGIAYRSLIPQLFLPSYLRRELGYWTRALVSMPVLNPYTLLNTDFDSYELMPRHNDMAAMVERMTFDPERPTFWLLNVGETHYPYALPDEDPKDWPHLAGLHGTLRRIDEDRDVAPALFDSGQLRTLQERQVRALGYLDGVFARLFDILPSNTWVVVTSDHGELFGEDGYFGHGPINHEKVLEVPFVEGLAP